MNENKSIFQMNDELEEIFLGSKEHDAMKKIVNLMNDLSQKKTADKRELVLQ